MRPGSLFPGPIIWLISFPFEGFYHSYHIFSQVFIDRREGVSVRRAVTIDRSTQKVFCGVGHKELAGRRGVSFKVKEYDVHMCLGTGIFAFGNRCSMRGIPIDKLERIVSEFAQVVMNRFVGTVDGSIEVRIIDVYPIGFIHVCTGFHEGITRERESIWVARALRVKRHIGRVGRSDAEIAVGLRGRGATTRYQRARHDHTTNYFFQKAHFYPNYGAKVVILIEN